MVTDSDDQVFQIHVPEALRTQWDAVLLNLISENQQSNPGAGDERFEVQAAAGNKTVNDFLIAFINHTFKEEMDYVIKERGHLQRLLSMVPPVQTIGTFYIDRNRRYTDMLFYGIEPTLICQEFLLFAVVDWELQSYGTALLVTYFVGYFIKTMRARYGQQNLAAKTMVAEHFLI